MRDPSEVIAVLDSYADAWEQEAFARKDGPGTRTLKRCAQTMRDHARELCKLRRAATPQPASADVVDARRLDAVLRESWKLEPFDIPTGAGDADVGWRVVQYHGSEPRERVVAEVYSDDPRAAIDAAMTNTGPEG
jgi:hypothetical protein